MYRLMTELVEQRICPFRLRSYDMQEPENVLLTETYQDLLTLKKFLHQRRLTQRESQYLVIQLLYALETNWRLGLRHNDLHPNNVFVKPCRGFNLKLTYLDRNNRQHVITMPGCRFVILMFDNDRVTKLPAMPVCADKCLLPKNRTFKRGHDARAVTNLFPWHSPQLRTGLLNQFKLLQHVYSEGQPSLRALMKKSHVGFGNRELMQHGRSWCGYEDSCFRDLIEYLLIVRHGRHEPRYLKNLPDFVRKMPNTDEMMLKLLQTRKNSLVDRRQYVHFSMKRLYK
jgi:serine/threonine protein kinase